MARESHTVTIDTSGNVTVDVSNIKGSSCKDATKALENALGITVTDSIKRDYYEQPEQSKDTHRQ